ncbi:MAG: nitrous oxide reductase accessory protein NosL [Candidatus Thiodiazotropha sp.]
MKIDRHKPLRRLMSGLLIMSSLIASPLCAELVDLPAPGPRDTCPVCGMFVAKYPEWVATARYKDGHAHHFDGAKDLFKYLLDLGKWAPNHQLSEIETIGVTEYYGLQKIDARQAWYVIGSDVLGPMGHELIPLETQADADEFLKDHQGAAILRYRDVTLKLLDNLDHGIFR